MHLSALLEYLTAEVLELSGNCCKDLKLKVIKPRHMFLSIKGDEELTELMGNACLAQSGAIPHVNKALINRRKQPKTRKAKTQQNDTAASAVPPVQQ